MAECMSRSSSIDPECCIDSRSGDSSEGISGSSLHMVRGMLSCSSSLRCSALLSPTERTAASSNTTFTAAHHPTSSKIVHQPRRRLGSVTHKDTLPRAIVKLPALRLVTVNIGRTAEDPQGAQISSSTGRQGERYTAGSTTMHTSADMHRSGHR
jgi:hypothetical protein